MKKGRSRRVLFRERGKEGRCKFERPHMRVCIRAQRGASESMHAFFCDRALQLVAMQRFVKVSVKWTRIWRRCALFAVSDIAEGVPNPVSN